MNGPSSTGLDTAACVWPVLGAGGQTVFLPEIPDGNEGESYCSSSDVLRKRKPEEPRREEEAACKLAMPLKKRPRMHQLVYPIGHGINQEMIPVMAFTFEEEFTIADYIVRIEESQNMRFNLLLQHFKHYPDLLVNHVRCPKEGRKIPYSKDHYPDLLVNHVRCPKEGRKIPYSKDTEKSLFNFGLEFTKKHCSNIFTEMRSLSGYVQRNVLNSTFPALYVVFFSILEGNAKEKTWLEQHRKTLHITDQNHAAVFDRLVPFTDVRSINLKDQERFTSPWARDIMDEEKFEKVTRIVGRLLGGDLKLQALYHMLVMFTPSTLTHNTIQEDAVLHSIQIHLMNLIYRYLSNLHENLHNEGGGGDPEEPENMQPATKTQLLVSLIQELHDCADIMQNRSLPGQSELVLPYPH